MARCLRALPVATKILGFQSQLFQGNSFMLRKPAALCLLVIALATVLFSAGCSGPDAPAKKSSGTGTGSGTGSGSGTSLTTSAP